MRRPDVRQRARTLRARLWRSYARHSEQRKAASTSRCSFDLGAQLGEEMPWRLLHNAFRLLKGAYKQLRLWRCWFVETLEPLDAGTSIEARRAGGQWICWHPHLFSDKLAVRAFRSGDRLSNTARERERWRGRCEAARETVLGSSCLAQLHLLRVKPRRSLSYFVQLSSLRAVSSSWHLSVSSSSASANSCRAILGAKVLMFERFSTQRSTFAEAGDTSVDAAFAVAHIPAALTRRLR